MQPSVILITRLLQRGPHLAVHLNSWDESASNHDFTTGKRVCKVNAKRAVLVYGRPKLWYNPHQISTGDSLNIPESR